MKTFYVITHYMGGKSVASNRHTQRRDAAARELDKQVRAMIWANAMADTRRGWDVIKEAMPICREVFDGRFRKYFDEFPTLEAKAITFLMRQDEPKGDRVVIAITRNPQLWDQANAEDAVKHDA